MTDTLSPTPAARPPAGSFARRTVVPLAVTVLVLLVLTVVQRLWVGRPEVFWSVSGYRVTMDAVTLARLAVVLFSSLVTWPVMWLRGAPFAERAIGVLTVPLVYAATCVVDGLTFFPPLQALYYGTNPIVLGAMGAQVASAAIGGAVARWLWRRRNGVHLRVVTPGAVLAVVLGTAVPVLTIGWDGGIHWFYPWMQVYVALFGSGT